MMDYRTVFASALGLTPPWEVVDIKFSLEEHRLDIWVNFPPSSTFACPTCGRAGTKVYDSEEKTWRHLNFFQYRSYLHGPFLRLHRFYRGGGPIKSLP